MSGIVVRRGTVLVVDDDVDLRELVSEELIDQAYDVASAEHGEAALALLRGGLRPDVILLDLTMPAMDGRSFLEHLDARPDLAADASIIVSTARPDAARDLPSSVDLVLIKPVSLVVLLESIASGCREAQHARSAHHVVAPRAPSPQPAMEAASLPSPTREIAAAVDAAPDDDEPSA